MKLRRVYFYWLCPEPTAFEWFADLLKELELKMAEAGRANFFSCNIYLTRGWDTNLVRNFHLHLTSQWQLFNNKLQVKLFPFWF